MHQTSLDETASARRAAQRPRRPPSSEQDIHDLCGLLQRIADVARDRGGLRVGQIVDVVGTRAFGPLLLLPGLVLVSPLSAIPTLPSLTGLVILLIAGQVLVGRRTIWLPEAFLRRPIDPARVSKAVAFLSKVARPVDRVMRPRLKWLTGALADRVVAAICIAIALTIPPLEIFPMLSSSAGAVVSLLALGLLVRDGLVILVAYLLLAAAVATAAGFVAA